MSKGSIITLVVLLTLVVGGFLALKESQKAQSAAEGKASAIQAISGIRTLRENQDYLRGLIDRHHAEAFKVGFKRSHLFAPTEFDEQAYLEALWTKIAETARADGKPEIADDLPGIHVSSGERPKPAF